MPDADLPQPLPPPGAPVRVAFLGQRTYFEACAMPAPAGGVRPTFVDVRSGDDAGPALEQLARLDPHVVVCFRPESLPAGALASIAAPVLGVLTEPLPRGGAHHPELDHNLAQLRGVDLGGVERVVCADPLSVSAAREVVPVWRSLPLPVSDALYRRPALPHRPPRVVFIGYPTAHREGILLRSKHNFDIKHYAHGLMGDDLREVLDEADVGIHLHGDAGVPSFESRIFLHLAAGHLVLSEPLDPTMGLEPEVDFIPFQGDGELDLLMHQLHQRPEAFDRVRIYGHHTSQQFRASAVWPRVIADLVSDLETFGTRRPARSGV